MAAPTGLLFVDSFDHYNTLVGMQGKWTVAPSNPGFVTGRSGSRQALVCGNAQGGAPSLTFGWEYPTICQGIACKTQSFTNDIFGVNNALTTPFETAGIGLAHIGDGRLRLNIPFGPNTGPLGGFVMSLNTWYYFEMQLTFTGGAGSNIAYEIRVNNAVIATGILLRGGTYSDFTIAGVYLGSPGGGNANTFDDYYITDGEFLGDASWVPIYANALGGSSDFTPSPAVANWTNASEHAPDYFTSYNEAASVGNQDLYNMDDLGGQFRVVGAHALNSLSKSAAGISSAKSSINTNATLVQEVEFSPSFGSWIYQRTGYRKNPVTGVDWTAAEINAIQRGALRIT